MKIGSYVIVLDEDIKGHVVHKKGNVVTIETPDGLFMEFDERELIKIDSEISKYDMVRMDVDKVITDKGDAKKQVQKIETKTKKQLPVMEVDLHIG